MLKVRLARRGRKKQAIYDIVVANSRAPRDGRFIEKLGLYNPNTTPATITLNNDRSVYWLLNGAQPTATTRAILSYKGVMYRKHLQVGVNKGAITQEEADAKYATWVAEKEGKIANRVDNLAGKKDADKKARIEAESKINQARADASRKKQEAEKAAKDEAVKAKSDTEKAKSDTEKAAADAIKSEKTEAAAE